MEEEKARISTGCYIEVESKKDGEYLIILNEPNGEASTGVSADKIDEAIDIIDKYEEREISRRELDSELDKVFGYGVRIYWNPK